MKRLVLAALAIGAMAACTKSNVQLEQPGQISFQPVAQKATKAAVDGTYYPTDAAYNFNVWAWWADKAANTADTEIGSFNTIYINKQTFKFKELQNWGGLDKPYYWPTTGSLFFAGYSPANAPGGFGYSHGEKKLIITGYEQSEDISKTTDLMWFHLTDKSYDRTTASVPVPVQFHHALSWLSFRFNLVSADTPQDWTIKSVKLTGIETKGNFTAVKGNSSSDQGTATWSEWSETKEVQVYNKDAGYPVKYVTNAYDPLEDDPSVLENTKNGVLVIPQSCAPADAELVIEFQQVAPSGTIVSQKKTLELGTEWLPGKHYIYTITFGAEEILIAPTVVDWTKVDDLTVPVE
jgi:hypothetical protein